MHSFEFILAKLDMVNGQLHEKHGSCATSGSKIMTQSVNKLKLRSKTDENASVGLKNNKTCWYSFRDKPFRLLVNY